MRDVVVNMKKLVEWRELAGEAAEEIALGEERRRLVRNGRADLARRVRLVSDRPALGYDIRSFELNGLGRHIEVKGLLSSSAFI